MSMAIVDGALLKNDRDFYVTVAQQIDFGVGYGNNYHAFDDRLGFDLERPIHITWKNHALSEAQWGDRFRLIVALMEKIQEEDKRYQPEGKRFTYTLE